MKRRLLILTLSMLFLLSGISYAQIKPEADLDNFRGMKWGMDIAQLPKDEFKEVESAIPGEIELVKNNEDLDVLGIKAERIKYRFKANRFRAVSILFSFDQKEELRVALREFLGNPSGTKERPDSILWIEWKGDNIWVTESMNFKHNFIGLYISSFAELERTVDEKVKGIKEKAKKGF